MTEPRGDEIKGGTDGPGTGALPALEPPPVLAGRPALAPTRVRLATVAARYNWNLVLMRPKWRDWRIPSWTGKGLTLQQGPGLLQ